MSTFFSSISALIMVRYDAERSNIRVDPENAQKSWHPE
jgi:hypothetical protein